MALPPQNSDAFIREVDEELRRDQIFGFWARYGRTVLVVILVGLAVFAGFLYWRHHQDQQAGLTGEKLQAAVDKLSANRFTDAKPALEELTRSDRAGYRAAARLALGGVAAQADDARTAAARFAEVAGDAGLPQPLRDLALIRQTAVEFDQLPPQTVITRLQPLAQKGSAWFGSAGEMVAAAHLKAGRPEAAGPIFAAIAADPSVPETIRTRAVQIAALLGVDNQGR
ncbi:tetratricopeptide repeat protein [Sphingomonas changnyeongensis]|uniref:Tetratricopeptide repeat protein n=1 Tax=Sphingomonas changnyeongensis TaxID=2698679 RepID=A0A7Z2S7W5_9SPHN|nr:tetratricopeptide repeat protein [Sphingomonas changnyeongensis]QHL90751.1 tetratricopeptide repeat protein [Sphingomonas changnyeongensis]